MKIQKCCKRGYRGLAALLCAALLLSGFPTSHRESAQAAMKGTILASSLYVRSGPGTAYDKITVNGQDVYLTKNTVVDIASEKDGWYYVTATFEGQTVKGYVSGKYVSAGQTGTSSGTPTGAALPTAAPSNSTSATEFSVPARIWVSELNIRQSAGTSGTVLDTLKSGAAVTVTGQTYVGSEKWYKVTYRSAGKTVTGYAYAPYVTLNGTIPTATPTPTAEPTTPPETGGPAEEFSIPAKVIASVVNIRSGAGTGNPIITALTYGAAVTATGISYVGNDIWYRISFQYNGTGKVGYAYGPYLALEAAVPTATPKPTATPEPTATAAPTGAPVPEGILADYRIPATVTAGSLNVREQAGTSHTVLAVLVRTAQVTATGSCYVGTDQWYCIEFTRNGKKITGYVFGEYLKLSEAEPTKAPSATATQPPTTAPTAVISPTPVPTETPAPGVTESYAIPARVSATQLNLRKGPGTEHEVIVLMNKNTPVTVIGEAWKETDKWYQVTADGAEGYALSDYIRLEYETSPDAMLTKQVRLRSGASDSAAYIKNSAGAIVILPADTAVVLTGEQTVSSKWFEISCEINGETVKGFVPAENVKLGKAVAPTPTIAPTPTAVPTPTATPTTAPEATASPTEIPETTPTTTPAVTPEISPTLTVAPGPTKLPEAKPTPTAAPTATPAPQATPAAEAKENTAGEQVGWGKATHPNASSMILKVLPKSGVGSVKVIGNEGRAVTITSETYLMLYGIYVDTNGNLYRHVGVTYRGNEYYGYILEERITECEAPPTPTPVPDFEIWGEGDETTTNPGVVADFELSLSLQGFPESYKPYLRKLHDLYPNWVFQAYHTGLQWDVAVAEESIPGKNLIPNSYGIEWKSLEEGAYNWKTDSFIVYDGSTWVTASKAALEYYMDPRNFLDDKSIFQFEVLTYEPSYQNLTGIENILKYTPLYQTSYVYEDEYGALQSISYAQTFLEAAIYSGVSPYHLATRVKQEVITGTTTVSNSVTGTVSGYEGLYNFYNIGAYHSTQAGGAIANGLKYAKYGSSSNDALNDASLIPWDNRYSAIVGGAYIIGDSYINRGQNTIYLQKFNMTSYYTYSHQYMANVVAPSSEGKKTAQAYTGATDSPIVFSIPVYLGMPESAAPEPTLAYNPNNYLASLSVKALDGTTYQLTPSFNGSSVFSYSLIVDNSTEVISIAAKAVSSKAAVAGVGYHPLETGVNELTVCVIAEDGSTREYQLYVVRE